MGELVAANEQFSHVAQMDFNYRDVRQKVDEIRAEIRKAGEQSG